MIQKVRIIDSLMALRKGRRGLEFIGEKIKISGSCGISVCTNS